MHSRNILALGCVLLAAAVFQNPTGDGFKPGKLTDEEVAKLHPGLTLRFLDAGSKAQSLDARRVRVAALHVPAGSPPSTFLPAGQFTASLTGFLNQDLNGEARFKFVGSGAAELSINNKPVVTMTDGAAKESAVVELVQGYNKVEVRYSSPKSGDATLRVYWSSDEFGWEPLPTDRLFSRGDEAELIAGLDIREGRLLFATHGCAQCHGLPGKVTLEQCRMPEMQQRAPSLENAGHRFTAAWIAQWVADPHALRTDATMPRLLQGAAAEQQADDLAAFLTSLKAGKPLPASQRNEERSADGEQMFLNLGCVTCHTLQPPTEKDNFNRLSLYSVGAKFAPGALEAFLKAPHQYYAWSRMPDFKLTAEEAAALASYVLDEAKGKIEDNNRKPGDAANGAKLFDSVGCAQCHTTKAGTALPRPMIAFPKTAAKGCLARDAVGRGTAPDFVLTGAQRHSLGAFLASDGVSLTRETPAEFSLRQMKLLQCNACHTRDGVPSRWYTVLSEEGAGLQPEYLPRLTWTGEKLHPEWTEKLLAGQHDHRARPWLKARMPAFPPRAPMLAAGLSHEHGFAVKEDPQPAPNAKLALIGEKLIPQAGGFACNQCHAIGSTKAQQPFGSDGINLVDAALRLRYEFYARWIMNPPRVDPTTKMTKFTEEGGRKTKIADVFDGDARQQFDAIWQYMQTLPRKE